MKERLKAFVESHPDGWNHDDWLGLLSELQSGGEAVEPDAVGSELEKTRLAWVLDQRAVPGLGPKRRAALVDRFETLGQLRSASVDEVAEVPSINKDLAGKVLGAIH
jgi:excinuclease ABC subunit C